MYIDFVFVKDEQMETKDTELQQLRSNIVGAINYIIKIFRRPFATFQSEKEH